MTTYMTFKVGNKVIYTHHTYTKFVVDKRSSFVTGLTSVRVSFYYKRQSDLINPYFFYVNALFLFVFMIMIKAIGDDDFNPKIFNFFNFSKYFLYSQKI